jgi:hypothetical protein
MDEAKDKPRKVGRPSIFSQAIADKICHRMAEGKSLRRICRDPRMPSRSVVHQWLKTNQKFREDYEWARRMLLDGLADDIIDIADDATHDFVEREGPNGERVVVVDLERIKRDRFRVGQRKWALSKLLPRKYGRSSELDLKDPLLPAGMALQPKVDKAEAERAHPLAKAVEAWRKAAEASRKAARPIKKASDVEP